jgi:hypothetical protein
METRGDRFLWSVTRTRIDIDKATVNITEPSVRPISGTLLVIAIFALLLAVYAALFGQYFPLPGYRMGHDYSLSLTAQLDGYFWYRNNGWAIPWFTPSFCAGQPYYADPQSGYYSLPQILANHGNLISANYLTLLLMASLSFWGGYLLMRLVFATHRPSAVLVAGLLMFNGFLSYRMIVGHIGYHGFGFLPWIALLLLLPTRSPINSATAATATGCLLAYWVHSGLGTLIIPAGLGIGLIALLHALRGNELKSFLLRSAIAFLVACLLSASKLVAVISFMGNFPRDFYPLPGLNSLLDSLLMVIAGLSLPSEWTYRLMSDKFANVMWAHLPHEWAYGFTPMILLLALALAFTAPYVRFSWPKNLRTSMLLLLLGLGLIWPVTFSTYGEEWNTFLKSIPVLGSTSTPVRWLIVYIPFVAVMTGLVLQKKNWTQRHSWWVTIGSLTGVAAFNAVEPTVFYKSQNYDARPILVAEATVRDRYTEPAISKLGTKAQYHARDFTMPIHSNDTFVAGVSQILCYNPIFGYRLEAFSTTGLVEGDVTLRQDGGLNLKNPACYVFPKENNCLPGARFSIDQEKQAYAFTHYKPYFFEMPAQQIIANRISYWSLLSVAMLITYWVLQHSWSRIRRKWSD